MDAAIRQGFGDFRVSCDLGTEDHDVELFGIEHLSVIGKGLGAIGCRERAFEIRFAAAFNFGERGHARHGIRAGDKVDSVVGEEPRHEFVHVHVGESDDTQPVGLSLAGHTYSAPCPTRPSAPRSAAPTTPEAVPSSARTMGSERTGPCQICRRADSISLS